MSEPDLPFLADPRILGLGQDFSRLPPEDQDLVLRLVARLVGQAEEEYPPDVSFMDFDE